jgi:hypothetical protein
MEKHPHAREDDQKKHEIAVRTRTNAVLQEHFEASKS